MTRSAIAFAENSDVDIVHVQQRRNSSTKVRAVRVDEADHVLDVQAAIDPLHPLDLRHRDMLAYHYSEGARRLRLGPDSQGRSLRITASQQHHGLRHWWICPKCQRRCRYLYYFRDVLDLERGQTSSVLSCRKCLGLVYASQARHRCADHDRRLAHKGNVDAQRRIASRIRRDGACDGRT